MFNELAGFAVVVVVDGAAAVVIVAAELGGQFEGVANAGQHDVLTVGRDGALQFDAAVGIDGVDLVGGKLEVVGREVALVYVEAVGAFGGAVAVAVGLARTLGGLALHGEGELHGAVLLGYECVAEGFVLQVVESVLEPCVGIAYASVVVGGCAPEVGLNGKALLQHGLAVQVQVVYPSRVLVEHHAEVGSRKGERGVDVVLVYLSATVGLQDAVYGGEGVGLYHHLLACHGISCLQHGLSLLQAEVDVEYHLALDVCGQGIVLQMHAHLLLRGYLQCVASVGQGAVAVAQRPGQLHVVECLEEVLVVHLDDTLLEVYGLCPDVLVVVTYLVACGWGTRSGLMIPLQLKLWSLAG